MQAFLERNPETVQALTIIKGQPVSSGFENSTFHGLNAFRFINSAGESIPVRWLLTPGQPFEAARAAPPSPDKKDLFGALIAQGQRHPLRLHLLVIIGQPRGPTHHPTSAWP